MTSWGLNLVSISYLVLQILDLDSCTHRNPAEQIFIFTIFLVYHGVSKMYTSVFNLLKQSSFTVLCCSWVNISGKSWRYSWEQCWHKVNLWRLGTNIYSFKGKYVALIFSQISSQILSYNQIESKTSIWKRWKEEHKNSKRVWVRCCRQILIIIFRQFEQVK